MKVWVETCNGGYVSLTVNLQGGYVSLTVNLQSNLQGVCNFDCKFTIELTWPMFWNPLFSIKNYMKN